MVTISVLSKGVKGNERYVTISAIDVTNGNTYTVPGIRNITGVDVTAEGVAVGASLSWSISGNVFTFTTTSNSGTDDYRITFNGV